VTPRFFVVSSFRKGKIWYDRCNFAGRYINCVLINYPGGRETPVGWRRHQDQQHLGEPINGCTRGA
jgi:hypothetical protein